MIKAMKRYRVNVLLQKQHWFWKENIRTEEFDVSAVDESGALKMLACMFELAIRQESLLRRVRYIPLAAWEI